MFDVGFSELLLLAVVGLLVLGPERLPRVARTLGGLTRKARSSWMNLKRSIDAEINAEELKKPLRKMQDEVRSAVGVVDEQLKKATEAANSPVTGKTANPTPSANPTTGTPAAAATAPSNAKPANNDQH